MVYLFDFPFSVQSEDAVIVLPEFSAPFLTIGKRETCSFSTPDILNYGLSVASVQVVS